MTDSRITWSGYPGAWDAGQKTFFASNRAHMFGFCGNASFPPSVARQLVEQIEARIIGSGDDPSLAHAEIYSAVQSAYSAASHQFFDGFALFHGFRESEFMKSKFHLWRIQYSKTTDKLYDTKIDIEKEESCLAHIDGSGLSIIRHYNTERIGRGEASTSRAAMLAFYEALESGKDRATGGAPQMVGIWRKGPARRFGIVWKKSRYVAGLKIGDELQSAGDLHWFDEQFNSIGTL